MKFNFIIASYTTSELFERSQKLIFQSNGHKNGCKGAVWKHSLTVIQFGPIVYITGTLHVHGTCTYQWHAQIYNNKCIRVFKPKSI